ncbi:MAG: alpha/beta fold hydrolase [Rhodobacteraceae bacterium]|nr:alpha/beta fold hydrolase [Paracoccaceae bacterium]
MTTINGFLRRRIGTNGLTLSVQEAGTGPALILLHGYPQNGMCWAKVAPTLAEHFHVLIPDLRGYGQSDAPCDDEWHGIYSKRAMAADITGMMDALGIDRAHILGHDRGARVAYRLALDAPDRVRNLGIIEILPTADYWAHWDAGLGMAAYHWTFLAQPAPLPEKMIGADPVFYIDWTLRSWTRAKSLHAFPPDSLATYHAQARDPARIAAMCADYRAGASYDRALDEADRAAGRKIAAPLHFLWATTGFPSRLGQPAALWRAWADHVTDASCDSGHFAMEEAPEAVLAAYLPFFTGSA